MNQLSKIARVTDAEAARLARPDTMAGLATQITAGPAYAASSPGLAGSARPAASPAGARSRARRAWLLGVPLAAGIAAAAVIVALAVHPASRAPSGQAGRQLPSAPAGNGQVQAHVLSFVRHGRYIDVIVRDPSADPAQYRAEFARHHLNITLKLVPASPSIVGTVVYFGGTHANSITPITAVGACHVASGGDRCPVGVRVPVHFRGQADLVFGRAARPGEQYESTASAFAPGEAMHGLNIHGKTVAQVEAMLSRRHVTAARFNVERKGIARNLRRAPGQWYVYDAVPWAPRQVLLFVGPSRTQPPAGAPVSGSPAPSPSPTRS